MIKDQIEKAAEAYQQVNATGDLVLMAVRYRGFLTGANFVLERAHGLEEALELIAAPKRADGTYNRCREACEELAKSALVEWRVVK